MKISTLLLVSSLMFTLPLAPVLRAQEATVVAAPPRALYVYHPATDTVIASENATAPMGPASLTKLMTLYLLFEALEQGGLTLETEIPVSEKAWRTGGSKMFIEVGKTVRVEDLIRGIAIVSGNDACVAVAEYLGGTESGFAQRMNDKARQLGMTGTTFINASGLPAAGQITTARDMALLLTALFRDFPQYKGYLSEEEFSYNEINQRNRNRLLSLNIGIDASKTGHTEESGYHLASTAVQNGERLVVVVMGADGFADREGRTLQALRSTFATHRRHTLLAEGGVAAPDVAVWHGTQRTVPLVVREAVEVFTTPAAAEQAKLEAKFEAPLMAPLAADQPVGELVLTMAEGQTKTYGLFPAQAVERAGFLGRWWQSLLRLIGLWG